MSCSSLSHLVVSWRDWKNLFSNVCSLILLQFVDSQSNNAHGIGESVMDCNTTRPLTSCVLFSPISLSRSRNFGFRCKGTNSCGWVFSFVNRTLLEQVCDVCSGDYSRHKASNCIIYVMQRISYSR